MAIPTGTPTTTSSISNLVQAAYDQYVRMALRSIPVMRSLADVKPVQQAMPGSSVVFSIYSDLAQATSTLTETSDVSSIALGNPSQVTVTLNEYGSAVTTTKIASGGTNKVLVTDGTGTVVWINATAFGAVADMTTIEGAGTTASPFKVKDLGIITDKLNDFAVTTIKIADANVTNTKLANDAVSSVKILDGTITTVDLANNSVETAKLADGSVTTLKLANDAVENVKIKNDAVTINKIANDAVTSLKIKDGEIVDADVNTSANIAYTKLNLASAYFSIDSIKQGEKQIEPIKNDIVKLLIKIG